MQCLVALFSRTMQSTTRSYLNNNLQAITVAVGIQVTACSTHGLRLCKFCIMFVFFKLVRIIAGLLADKQIRLCSESE